MVAILRVVIAIGLGFTPQVLGILTSSKPQGNEILTSSSSPPTNITTPSTIHPRHIIRKRMLSWDCENSAHAHYMAQIPWTYVPSYHNWHGWHAPDAPDLIPQRLVIHDESELYNWVWHQVWNSPAEIVGFLNEPDISMTPERGADLWMAYMAPLRAEKGKLLMSPACSSSSSGTAWCDRFIDIVTAKGQAPNFQAVHYYGTDPCAAIEYLEDRRNRYGNMDIFVLEIASVSRVREEVFAFTAEVTNWMDATGWVREYAWFGFMPRVADGFVSPAAQLMGADGGLSELGRKLLMEQPMRW